jgi:hypothetical protein
MTCKPWLAIKRSIALRLMLNVEAQPYTSATFAVLIAALPNSASTWSAPFSFLSSANTAELSSIITLIFQFHEVLLGVSTL